MFKNVGHFVRNRLSLDYRIANFLWHRSCCFALHPWVARLAFASVAGWCLISRLHGARHQKGPPEMMSGDPFTAGSDLGSCSIRSATVPADCFRAHVGSLGHAVKLVPGPLTKPVWLHSAPTTRATIWLIRAIPCPEASVACGTCRYVAIAYRTTIDPAWWWRSPAWRWRWSPAPDWWTPVIPWWWAPPVRTRRRGAPTRGWRTEGIGRTGWQGQRAKCGKDQCYGDRVDEFHDRNSCRKSEGR